MNTHKLHMLFFIILIYFTFNGASLTLPEFQNAKIQSKINRNLQSILKMRNSDSTAAAKAVLEFPNIVHDYILPFLKKIGETKDTRAFERVSDQCAAHMTAWGQNILEFWSLSMLDATSKINEGLLSGHKVSYGDFDECLAVRAEFNTAEDTIGSFRGEYCSGSLIPEELCVEENGARKIPSTTEIDKFSVKNQTNTRQFFFNLGIYPGISTCFPNTCSTSDIEELGFQLFNNSGICMTVSNCVTDDKQKLSSGDIGMKTLLGIIVGLCIVGTAIDLANLWSQKYETSKPNRGILVQGLIAFSVYTNTRKWANTSGGSDNLGCVHGIRFLSTCWVVLAHTWSTWPQRMWNINSLLTMPDEWTLYPIINGTVSVDTFFALSAMLVAYSLLKMLEKTKGRINIPMVYVHRYLRLSPTYAILIGIMATWFHYLRPGPETWGFALSAEACQKYWWHNLLYVNNLIKYGLEGGCHGEAWYLAKDMQIFLITPFIIFAVWKWNLIGLGIMGLITVAAVAVPFGITYSNKLDATLLIFSPNSMEYNDKSYVKPWMRFGPYITGLWGGYLLYKLRTRKTPLKLPFWVPILGWSISTATALAIIFGIMPYFALDFEYRRVGSAFYAAFHRFAWGLVISWVILACTAGYGGLINTFLSWKAFVPLGRLTFCAYLISFWLQILYITSMRQAITYDLYTGINLFFGYMVLSLLVSFVATITFESPLIALEKLIFQRDNSKG